MKHLIVIETADGRVPAPEEGELDFQTHIIKTIEALVEHYCGECFIQSRFYEKSALAACHEMFNAPNCQKPT